MPIDAQRVQAVFLEATEIEGPAERARFLDGACDGDPELRSRVEALLRSHDGHDTLLDQPTLAPREHDLATDRTVAFEGGETGHDEVPLGFLSPATRADSLGRIGHYEVLQVLGQGGFGIVLRAFDDVLHRVVAVKVLSPQIAATSPARKRFLREARSSAQVRHENVVQVYEVGEQPLPYIAMEFIPGETLQQRLDRTGPLDVPEVLRIGRQVAEGLAAAHATDLIHRDIKPGNILLESGQFRVKITDFGLARAADDASISQSGIIAGTPMYMAPEQAKGETLDRRADLFSLGSVLYVMASGRPPFRANNTVAVLKRVAEDTPRPIREIIPETPPWLCEIIAKLHAKDPDERFQSAREVADVLADCEAQLKANSRLKDFSRIPRGRSQPTGRRKWVAAAVLLLPAIALAATESAGLTHLIPTWQAAHDPIEARGGPTSIQLARREPPPPAVAPFTDADVQRIAALPAAEQVEEVRKELMRRNPGFDGKMESRIEHDAVTGMTFESNRVADIAPLRALTRLQYLSAKGSDGENGLLTDLSPLKGMPLVVLDVSYNNVQDLAPLRGMRLKDLRLMNSQIADLSPLRGMPLERLYLWTWVGTDLTPLRGMPLKALNCGGGGQRLELSQLDGLALEWLCVNGTQVSDLAPLRSMPLIEIKFMNTKVTDPSPLRDIKTLGRINEKPAAEFWKEVDEKK